MLVQEGGRIKKMKDHVANLVGFGNVSSTKGKSSRNGKTKDKAFIKGPKS